MGNSRVDNVIKNISTGVAGKISTTLMAFISRSVFIYTLGLEYLGISGLFTNVLRMLALAELGFHAAIIYSMYKPIADNDTRKLCALNNFFQTLFRIIALIVVALGLGLIPFLPSIVRVEGDIPHITRYYVLTLLDAVVSYLFVHKASITIAHQREYEFSLYNILMPVVKCVAQVVILLVFRDYTLYLVVQILCTILSNVLRARKSEKLFPYIREKEKLPKKDRKELFGHAKSMFLVNLSGVMLTQTDNLLISTMLSTALVGFYSNYTLILQNLNQVTNILSTALTASVGNLSVSESTQKKHATFETLDFALWWFHAFCTVTFWILAPDFFGMWGSMVLQNLRLSNVTVLVIVLNFYLQGIQVPLTIFHNTTGLFHQTRFMYLATALLNIALSVVLGTIWGITGILLATILANVLTVTWYVPKVLYRLQFKISSRSYWNRHFSYFLLVILCGGNLQLLLAPVQLGYALNLLVRGIACIVVPNGLFYLLFRNTDEYRHLAGIIREKLQKKLKKS